MKRKKITFMIKTNGNVGFKALTAVVMKSTVLWDVTLQLTTIFYL
jgi:hypothetical protein